MSLFCKIGMHFWDSCTCRSCGKTRNYNHKYIINNGCGKCIKCGKHLKHNWSKDCEVCIECGAVRENKHHWWGCKCSECGKIRDEQHDWSKDCEICNECGTIRTNMHQWNGCTCSKCGKIGGEDHDWSNDCEKCSNCNFKRSNSHVWIGCKCTLCGKNKNTDHIWVNDMCSICEKSKTTSGLEELYSILGNSVDSSNFLQKVTNAGYVFEEESPNGAVVMRKNHDKFIISVKKDNVLDKNQIFNLIYSNINEGVKVELVIEGAIVN